MRQRPDATGLNQRHDTGGAGSKRVDLPAHQRLNRRTGARERHMHHLDPGSVLQHFHRHMHRAVDARGSIAELAGLAFGRGDEFLQSLVRRVRTHHQHSGIRRDPRDRHELVQFIGRFAFQKAIRRGQDRNRRQAHQQRVAIRFGSSGLTDADGAPCAALILNDDRSAQLGTDRLSQRPCDGVGDAAGRERHHHRDGAVRVVGRHRRDGTQP
ncbi:hypothetical protein D3C87_1566250 [compost metagenome]